MSKSLSERVRQALRRVQRSESAVEMTRKLEAMRCAFEHEFPTAEMDEMLEEIERGYPREIEPPSREETQTGSM